MELTPVQETQARYALDERVIELIIEGRLQEARMAYDAYLKVGGYFSFDLFTRIAAIRGKELYHSLLHVS